jgi:hypothetical protein
MAKKDLTDAEKAEFVMCHTSYLNEQLSQIFPNWAADMERMMHEWIDAGNLPAASKTKIKTEITADSIAYKAKGKK